MHKYWFKYIPFLLLLLAVGCRKKDSVITFTATMEEPRGDDKTYLVDERIVYWKSGDRISTFSDLDNNSTGTPNAVGTLEQNHYTDHANGLFRAALAHAEPAEVLALYPYNEDNQSQYSSEFSNIIINIPKTQEYESDETFANDCFPMVAWAEVGSPFYLNFHALAGLVRLQLFSTTTTKNISSIVFEEQSGAGSSRKPICQQFYVKGYSAAEPYLTYLAGPDDDNSKVTINCSGSGKRISSGADGIATFYLSLPYVPSGGNDYTTYRLAMTVLTTDSKQCKKTFNVTIKRNTITKVPALNITEWAAVGGGNGTASAELVGNGTTTKPFQIYTDADMRVVRNAYNGGGTINGMPLRDGMVFQVMRSDIRLTTSNWTEGIQDFTGVLTYRANDPDVPGITNDSYSPIFESIAPEGQVEGLTVKATISRSVTEPLYFSPFCYDNKGTINKCKLASTATVSFTSTVSEVESAGVGGLCVNNYGTIEASSSGARLSAVNHICAGICLFNHATVTSSYITSPGTLTGTRVAGIVYENEGDVSDSYFATNVDRSTADVGCIVYRNRDGRVSNCMVMSSGIVNTSGTYGGIVHTCTGGEINYCRNISDLVNVGGSAGNPSYGGIVCSMENGRVINCFCDIPGTSVNVTNGYAGGVIGSITGGEVRNCFARYLLGGGADVGSFVGNADAGDIANCYGWSDDGTTDFQGIMGGTSYDNVFNYNVGTDVTASFVDAGSICPLSHTVNDCDDLLTVLNKWVNNNGGDYMSWIEAGGGSPQPLLDGSIYAKKGIRH